MALYFTTAQIEEIKKRLSLFSKKDSQFTDATTPLSGNEKLAILQDNDNRLLNVADLISQSTGIRSGTTEYWNSQIGYIPMENAIIVYTDYETIQEGGETKYIPNIKIGTGNGYVQDLMFVGDDLRIAFNNHISNTIMHVTAQEKTHWNNKLNCSESVENETLIFNRD